MSDIYSNKYLIHCAKTHKRILNLNMGRFNKLLAERLEVELKTKDDSAKILHKINAILDMCLPCILDGLTKKKQS